MTNMAIVGKYIAYSAILMIAIFIFFQSSILQPS